MNSAESLVESGEIRVSSVLSKNSKDFGKQFLCDKNQETCWSSDQGCPQWVGVKWDCPVKVFSVKGKFQGGFAGSRETVIEGWSEEKKWEEIEPWPLEDTGELQTLSLSQPTTVSRLRILFKSSTDFFGRIIMYDFDILGEKG